MLKCSPEWPTFFPPNHYKLNKNFYNDLHESLCKDSPSINHILYMKFCDCESELSQCKYDSWGGISGKVLEEFLSQRQKKNKASKLCSYD